MKRSTLDTISGIVVLFSLVFLAYYSIKLGNMDLFGDDYYQVFADFDSVSGLKNGAKIELAGVDVGRVNSIALDQNTDQAKVSMNIRNGIQLQEDTIASIRTNGIIGYKYISISLGGSERIIPPGGKIVDTESSVNFEELISQFVHGKL